MGINGGFFRQYAGFFLFLCFSLFCEFWIFQLAYSMLRIIIRQSFAGSKFKG